MKKYLIAALLMAFVAMDCSAQQGWRIGLNAGPNFSRAGSRLDSVPDNFKRKTRIGYNFGIIGHYGFSDAVGIEFGIQCVNKGYRMANDTNSVEEILKSSFTTFEIPINFTLRQELSSYSFVREKVGFTLGRFAQSTDTRQALAAEGANFGVTETFKADLLPMINLGLEYGYMSDNGNTLIFGINYTQGLGNVIDLNFHNNNTYSGSLFSSNYRGSHLALRVAYLFNLSNIGQSEEYFFE